MARIINVHDAKTHFSRLLDAANAGEEIILAKAGKPYARLLPLALERGTRKPGRLAGRLAPAFFEALSSSELSDWE